MSRVASNRSSNDELPTSIPFMDKLTHSIIRETSKNLKHYVDVKRRENGFVLNPNSSSVDTLPLKARFMYGTVKEYPPLYGSFHSDNDVKRYLCSIRQHQRESFSTSNALEKQICREELSFHMRSQHFISPESQQFAKLQLNHTRRSNSAGSGVRTRALHDELSKSTSYQRDHLVDDAANILAALVKARQKVHTSTLLSRQTTPMYVSRNANPSPRQTDEQSNVESSTRALPPTISTLEQRRTSASTPQKKPKRTTANVLARAASIMQNAKQVTNNILCDYKITIVTGNCNGASTNAPISIKLYGTKGCTSSLELTQSESHQVLFQKNQTDVFNLQICHVGQLVGITIGHEREDMRASWFLSRVEIEDPIRERTYQIVCNAWLSSKSHDKKTTRDFQVTSMISNKKSINTRGDTTDFESQSDYSTTTTDRSANSISTNNSRKSTSLNSRRKKKTHKKRPLSIANKRGSHTEGIEPSPAFTPSTSKAALQISSNKSSSPTPNAQSRSPAITRSASSDSDVTVKENNGDLSRSRSPTSYQRRRTPSDSPDSLTRIKRNDSTNSRSVNNHRPPVGSENHISSSSRSKGENNDSEHYDEDFFD